MATKRLRRRCGVSVSERFVAMARKSPAFGGSPGPLGGVAMLARCTTSRGAPLLPERPGRAIERFRMRKMCSSARNLAAADLATSLDVSPDEPPPAVSIHFIAREMTAHHEADPGELLRAIHVGTTEGEGV